MPFDESFTDIYEQLIKDPFEKAGFSVFRADDIASQQNILSDVVTAITTSDVIIADLTDSNPNVYYELGLAHALLKSVVLLTQDIGSVPFDLRSYRILEYDIHFARFDDSRDKLAELAGQIASGTLVFGNPVSDFGPRETSRIAKAGVPATPKTKSVETEIDKPGFPDNIVDIEEIFQEITSVIERVGHLVLDLGSQAERVTPELDEAGKQQNVGQARNLMRSLGTEYQKHGSELRTLNSNFQILLLRAADALEIFASYQLESLELDEANVSKFLDEIDSFESQSREGRNSIVELTQVIEGIPRMERTFDKARNNISRELTQFTDNIDQFISMVLRVRGISRDSDGNL